MFPFHLPCPSERLDVCNAGRKRQTVQNCTIFLTKTLQIDCMKCAKQIKLLLLLLIIKFYKTKSVTIFLNKRDTDCAGFTHFSEYNLYCRVLVSWYRTHLHVLTLSNTAVSFWKPKNRIRHFSLSPRLSLNIRSGFNLWPQKFQSSEITRENKKEPEMLREGNTHTRHQVFLSTKTWRHVCVLDDDDDDAFTVKCWM